MRTSFIFLFLLAATATLVLAEAPAIEFAGDRFHLDYEDAARLPDGQPGNALAEFTLPGQTVNDWTKLFSYYVYPDVGEATASQMVAEVGKAVVKTNPDAKYELHAGKGDNDAIIDFLTWAPGSDVMEFNVFRYAPAQYGPGLVALQYAQRIKADDFDVTKFRALRERMVAAMAEADIAPARRYFADKTKAEADDPGAAPGSTSPAGADR
jgi:hypothetical protein